MPELTLQDLMRQNAEASESTEQSTPTQDEKGSLERPPLGEGLGALIDYLVHQHMATFGAHTEEEVTHKLLVMAKTLSGGGAERG